MTKSPSPTHVLRALLRLRAEFGPGRSAEKQRCLLRLEKARLPSAKAVLALHDSLCFLRAYPDDAELLALVERLLESFDRRPDLRRHRAELADSGVAGTALDYRFYGATARWLSARHPGALRVRWSSFEHEDRLAGRLALLATYSETPGLDEVDLPVRDWVRRLAGPHTTDADFLLRRFGELGRTEAERDTLYDELDLELRLDPGPHTPSRTRAHLADRPVHFQAEPLRRERPDVRALLRVKPFPVAAVDSATGERLVAMTREAMVTRHRDLDAFIHADARDVRLYACGRGLEIAVLGVKPERRLLLEAVYGYLMLKNGVPVGYVLTSALFGSSEIAFNVFDPWRGGEAAWLYGQVMALTHQLYGSDTFTIFPYQLGGDGNTEGLKSGAWWFYQKLGFRARDPEVLALMEAELARMRREPSHRTTIATLQRLAAATVYWSAGKLRDDVIGEFPIGSVGLAVTDYLAERFGADRERGARVCEREAAALCGVKGQGAWTREERLAFRRWAPLILILPGVTGWSAPERRALAEVARQKGGLRESDYVRALDGHRRLRRALRSLVRDAS